MTAVTAPTTAAPVVVEIAGPAGAGKTSLLRAIARLDPGVTAGLRVSRPQHLRTAAGLGRVLADLHWPFRGVRWIETKRVVHVEALYRAARTSRPGPLLLDEGPVYMLSRILVFGGSRLDAPGLQRWWRDAVMRWDATLRLVVWLDAPDAVLGARIRARAQPHPVKGLDDITIAAFLRDYRQAYERVLDELGVAADGRLHRFATDRTPIERIAAQVGALLEDACRS